MSRTDSLLRYFRQHDDFMQTTVKENIERYRKSDATLRFIDRNGKPVPGVLLEGTQINHEFKHGGNIFMLDELETPEKNTRYRNIFPNYFNLATVPFYWDTLEPEPGKPRYAIDSPRIYRRPATDLCVDYCREKGIEPKCHCLNYQSFEPAWLEGRSSTECRRLLEERIASLAARYRDSIPMWEVSNETFNPPERVHTPIYREDDIVEWCFRTADRYLPANRLIINEGTSVFDEYRWNRSFYYLQIERMLRLGVTHLDSIGIQFHSFFPREKEEAMAPTRFDPLHLYRVLDLYARFGRRLQITEMTLAAYSDGAEDEEAQAELLRNIYTVFFSHPAMEAIIYWNSLDGYAYGAEPGDMAAGENRYHGGLLRFDMSEKPAGKVLREFFTREYHTELPSRVCGETATFRGFCGDYSLRVTANGKTTLHRIALASGKNNEFTIRTED